MNFISLKSYLNKGHKRTVLAKKNILFSFFIKVFGMALMFLTVSLSIEYLGRENYGVWIVLSGLLAWSSIFDMGFSHGLRNKLAELIAHKDVIHGKYYVSSTYFFLILMALLMIVIFYPIIDYVNWINILNINSLDKMTLKYIIYSIFILFILQFILKPIRSILEAYQWPSIFELISLLGLLLSVLIIYMLLFLEIDSSLYIYIVVVAGTPIGVNLIFSIYLYKKKFPQLIPSVTFVKRKYLNDISGLGMYFFIIQLSSLIIYQTDNMIIAYLYNPSEVTNYNIVYRYFSIVINLFGLIIAPFWTAFTDAYVKGEYIWIQNIMKKLFIVIIIVSLFSIFLFSVSDYIYHIWISKDIEISHSLSGLMAIYVVLFGIVNFFSTFSKGISKIKIQVIVNGFVAIINLPLSYILASTFNMGVNGVILSTIICILFVGIILVIQYFKLINKKAQGIWDE